MNLFLYLSARLQVISVRKCKADSIVKIKTETSETDIPCLDYLKLGGCVISDTYRIWCHCSPYLLLHVKYKKLMHGHCGTNNRVPRWTFTDPCKTEVRPGAREESASPAWLAAPVMYIKY